MKPCPTGKLPFWRFKEAARDAERINNANKERSAVKAGPFFCKKCKLWHVGRSWRSAFAVSKTDEYMATRLFCPKCNKEFGKQASYERHITSSSCAATSTLERP